MEESPGSLPNRSLWVDTQGFHLAHVDRERGIVHRILSRETGQEITSQSYQVYPAGLPHYYGGLDAVAASPDGDLAFAFGYMDSGVRHEGVLSVSGETSTAWTPPWKEPYQAFGLGWDGEGFTASLLDFDLNWATARFSAKGEMLADLEVFARTSANYGYYDSETDNQSGTTVFVGAASPGVVVVGRRGRDSNLTSPAAFWRFTGSDRYSSGFEPAVALNGTSALVAWTGDSEGIVVHEVSLDTGESSGQWRVTTDNLFENVAAVRAQDRWVIVGQDRGGLVLAEIRDNQIRQRRLLRHLPACLETNTCPIPTGEWLIRRLSVVADKDSAWAGLIDTSTQRVEGVRTLMNYRILPLSDECTYESLASH